MSFASSIRPLLFLLLLDLPFRESKNFTRFGSKHTCIIILYLQIFNTQLNILLKISASGLFVNYSFKIFRKFHTRYSLKMNSYKKKEESVTICNSQWNSCCNNDSTLTRLSCHCHLLDSIMISSTSAWDKLSCTVSQSHARSLKLYKPLSRSLTPVYRSRWRSVNRCHTATRPRPRSSGHHRCLSEVTPLGVEDRLPLETVK